MKKKLMQQKLYNSNSSRLGKVKKKGLEKKIDTKRQEIKEEKTVRL